MRNELRSLIYMYLTVVYLLVVFNEGYRLPCVIQEGTLGILVPSNVVNPVCPVVVSATRTYNSSKHYTHTMYVGYMYKDLIHSPCQDNTAHKLLGSHVLEPTLSIL